MNDLSMDAFSANAEAAAAEISAIVRDQAERLFGEIATREALRAADRGPFPEPLWAAVEEAGLALALVDEGDGGAGLPLSVGMRVVRRAAYHSLPVPLAEAMLARRLWAEAGGTAIDGLITLAPPQPPGALALRRTAEGHVLSGRALDVPWGARADGVLLHARAEGGDALVLLGAGKRVERERRNLAGEPRDALVLEDVAIPAERVRPVGGLTADDLLVRGALLRVQQLVGAMQRCLDYAVTYAGERVQFGRPIGKFQAVQHMLAVAAGQVAAATAAADQTIDAREAQDLAFVVALAKARCGEAAGQVAGIAHQVHAAMGFTQEHPLHYATRRLWSWRDEFGHEAYWQERVGRAVCAAGGERLWRTLLAA